MATSNRIDDEKGGESQDKNVAAKFFLSLQRLKSMIMSPQKNKIINSVVAVWNDAIKGINEFGNWIKKNRNYFSKLIVTVVGGLIVYSIPKAVVNIRCYTKPYITFESNQTQVFHLSKTIPTLEYSVGEQRWRQLKNEDIVFGGSRGKLLIRGRSNLGTDGATISFATNAEVVCTGNINTLVDYRHPAKANTSEARFDCLFENCTQLVTSPVLSSQELADSCYYRMFAGCTSLRNAPELSSLNLSNDCYSCMFSGCTTMERAPELPAKQMAERCYMGMFSNCTSLKSTPMVLSGKLASNCFTLMFSGCTSLRYSPQLPADSMATACYAHMFSGCTSLKRAPKLPAEYLAASCYQHMFYGCTSLVEPPKLPAKNLATGCYTYMFAGCTLLNSSSMLPAEIAANGCYLGMYAGCTSLNQVTMLATNIDEGDCLLWLDSVSPDGTFYKNHQALWCNEGIVPQGWTIEFIEP